MYRILFVCHGNICRSTMAEFVLKDLVERNGLSAGFFIDSAATSREEIGNGIHPGTRRKLSEKGVFCGEHRARQLERADYEKFDLLLGMDSANVKNMLRILGGDAEKKVGRLLDFTSAPRDIADPWYTGDFEATYRDVSAGCTALLRRLVDEKTDFFKTS